MSAMASDSKPWMLASAAAVVVGSLGPWVTVSTGFGTLSASGTEGDGVITIGAGVAALIGVLVAKRWLALVGFLAAVVVGGYDVINVSNAIDEDTNDFARASVGWGLWLVLAGAIVGLVLTLIAKSARRRALLPPPPPPPPPPPFTYQ